MAPPARAPVTDRAGPGTTPGPAGQGHRLRDPLALGAVALTGAVALHLRDPHVGGSWGFCPWLLLTGTSCPGCGSLRAVNDLGHGDLAGAVSSNLLLVAMLPVALLLWVRWLHRAARGAPRAAPPSYEVRLWVALAGVALVFGVVRNTPAGAWLAP